MMSLPVGLPDPMFFLEVLCSWSHVPSRVASVQGGGICPERVSVGRPPPESEKRVVRILLECFLVLYLEGEVHQFEIVCEIFNP